MNRAKIRPGRVVRCNVTLRGSIIPYIDKRVAEQRAAGNRMASRSGVLHSALVESRALRHAIAEQVNAMHLLGEALRLDGNHEVADAIRRCVDGCRAVIGGAARE